MISLRDVLIFLAGAAFFHTFSHILLPYFVHLPLHAKGFTLTATFNFWMIVINLLITIGLLLGAYKVSRR